MATKIKFRTVYSARDEEHKGILFTSDSLAQQHFRDECDVNVIVDRYVKTGVIEHTAEIPPHFADVSDIPMNLFDAYNAVEAAEAAFMDLPAKLRKSLDNDPSRLSEWLSDPSNRQAAVEYGLFNSSVLSTNTVVEPNVDSVIETSKQEVLEK